MKKYRLVLAIMIIICLWDIKYTLSQQNKTAYVFELKNAYIIKTGNFKRTYIDVIVYDKQSNEEEMFEQIRASYESLNGSSNLLVIKAYQNTEDFKKHENFIERLYEDESYKSKGILSPEVIK